MATKVATIPSAAQGLDSTPDDIWGHITSNLPNIAELLHLEQTSKGIQASLRKSVKALTFPSHANDAAVIAAIEKFDNLTSLNLTGCRNLTDAAVVAVAEHCAGLTSLDLWGCSNLTDAAVVAVAEHCAGLTSLDLWGCSNLTDAAVVAVAEHCAGLTSLDLWGCPVVTLTLEEARRQVAERQAADEEE